MEQVENSVVIDSLWKGFFDFGRDVVEEYDEEQFGKICRMKIEIDVSKLTDDEIDNLIGEVEDLKEKIENCGAKKDFTVNSDLPVNFNAECKNYQLEIIGKCSENVYLDVLDVLDCCENITYTERRI